MTSIKFSGFQNLPRGRPEPERRGGSPKLAEADERGPLNSERRHALRRESSRPASRCRAVRPAGNVGGHCRRALSAGIVGGQCHGAVARVCANTATHPPCSALPVNLAPRFAGLPFFTGAFPRARFHGRVSTGAFPRARFHGRGFRDAVSGARAGRRSLNRRRLLRRLFQGRWRRLVGRPDRRHPRDRLRRRLGRRLGDLGVQHKAS
jgi:hypothetical protein